MQNHKRAPPVLAAAALLSLLLVGGTLAHLSDQRLTLNTLAIGQDTGGSKAIQLSLEEPSFAKSADETSWLLENPSAELAHASQSGLVPGQYIYKDPLVTNAGSAAFYLRVKFQVEDNLLTALQDSFGLVISPDFERAADGYYYRTDENGTAAPLMPGDSVYLFRVTPGSGGSYSMRVPAGWAAADIAAFTALHGDAKQAVGFSITAEAVQCLGFDGAIPWQGVSPIAVSSRRPAAP